MCVLAEFHLLTNTDCLVHFSLFTFQRVLLQYLLSPQCIPRNTKQICKMSSASDTKICISTKFSWHFWKSAFIKGVLYCLFFVITN
jgi:hypothetical protein